MDSRYFLNHVTKMCQKSARTTLLSGKAAAQKKNDSFRSQRVHASTHAKRNHRHQTNAQIMTNFRQKKKPSIFLGVSIAFSTSQSAMEARDQLHPHYNPRLSPHTARLENFGAHRTPIVLTHAFSSILSGSSSILTRLLTANATLAHCRHTCPGPHARTMRSQQRLFCHNTNREPVLTCCPRWTQSSPRLRCSSTREPPRLHASRQLQGRFQTCSSNMSSQDLRAEITRILLRPATNHDEMSFTHRMFCHKYRFHNGLTRPHSTL